MNAQFKPGDVIVHKSDSLTKWVIDSIAGDTANCSCMVGGIKKVTKSFPLTHIEYPPKPPGIRTVTNI